MPHSIPESFNFNRLNSADTDMPEWMFSKMMRSAKIRYSDHSIMRVIQLLGKSGNWRRVLQVIEWLETRERFKSHKLRCFSHFIVLKYFATVFFHSSGVAVFKAFLWLCKFTNCDAT